MDDPSKPIPQVSDSSLNAQSPQSMVPTSEPHTIAEEVQEEELEQSPSWGVPLGLFLVTVFTTLWAGAYQTKSDPYLGVLDFLIQHPTDLWKGIPFSVTLLGILVTHEFGHYFFSRVHRVPATLPLFIPGPPHFIGTFGAIIRMRGPILRKKALFDIGVAGPIAGFVVAVVALAIGLYRSRLVPTEGTYGLHLGEPLLLQFMSWLIIGPVPARIDILLDPIGVAAWFGLFITSLNLIPIGQFDGGHVAYALWGNRQRTIALTMVPILLFLGWVGWPGWFLWAGIAGLLGFAHPPVSDPDEPLGPRRRWVGWAALVIFLITFSPVPFYFQ